MKTGMDVVIVNKYGFHVRPSTTFVKMAMGFTSKITVQHPSGMSADGKNMMMLMTLGATCGTKIKITADGDDAQAAVDALVALVTGGFGGIE